LATDLACIQAGASVLPLGCQLHGVVLLETQEVVTRDSQQQVISCFQATIGQGRKEAFSPPLDFKDIHIKPALEPTIEK
tara:strand:+ start:147 stop:383 length:237 start_codon:yes stop_codon:yes gene_type:complete